MKIESLWICETGRWDDQTNSYVDISRRSETKQIGLRLYVANNGKEGLEFVGGPTGFEQYYLEDMVDMVNEYCTDFAICFGTINSWPKCLVKVADVRKFLEEEGKL
jgi:hypothetical protein